MRESDREKVSGGWDVRRRIIIAPPSLHSPQPPVVVEQATAAVQQGLCH